MDPNGTDGEVRQSRVLPGLSSISHTLHKSIITFTEPLSPSQSDSEAASSPKTPGFSDKLRLWSSHRKEADVPSDDQASEEKPGPLTLMTLPDELKILILSFLSFPDIARLRHVSKYWHTFATPRLIRSIYGPDTFRTMLIQHCRVCLTYCPRDVSRIATSRFDAGYPLSSRCLPCTVQSRDGVVRIGRKVMLGNFTEYWTCRWCGWPIVGLNSNGHVQFHSACYDKYALVLLAFFCLGWVQFLIGVVASGLAWHYFKHDTLVIAPTAVGFVLNWVCVILIMFRGNRVRTYHWALLIELAIAALWIPSMYQIAKQLTNADLDIPTKAATAIIAFVGLNMLFRLVNILGNAILIADYDRTKHYVPRIPIWRRFMNPLLTAMVFWTYPQHAERKCAPEWA